MKQNLKKEIIIPSHLSDQFEKDKDLNDAFSGLSPHKTRGYPEYIIGAKRDETKRNGKMIPMIKVGIGSNDK